MSEYKDKYQLFEYFKSVKNPNPGRFKRSK